MNTTNKRIVAVSTPTGSIGSALLPLLQQQDRCSLRLIARNPEKLPKEIAADAEVICGDLRDQAVLERAFDGAEALFWCQPDAPSAVDYLDSYESLANTASRAIRNCRVARVVAVSATGFSPNRNAGPISALHRMETVLEASKASFRFLRCGSFMENLLWQIGSLAAEGVFAYPVSGSVSGPQVAVADIARAAARWLQASDWSSTERLQVLGPCDLSYDQMAEILSEVLERPIRYVCMDAEAFRSILLRHGYSQSAAQGLLNMFDYLANAYPLEPIAASEPTSTLFKDWAASVLRPALENEEFSTKS